MDMTGFVPCQSYNLTSITSRLNTIRTSPSANRTSFHQRPLSLRRINSKTTTVLTNRRKYSTIYACTASSSSPEEENDDDDDDNDTGKGYHESWDIYSKPGNLCVICLGKGYSKCLYCYGKGAVLIGPESGRDTIECPQCEGSKRELCLRCEGSGVRPSFKYALNEAGDDFIKVPNLTNEQVNNLPPYVETEAYKKDLERKRESETEEEQVS